MSLSELSKERDSTRKKQLKDSGVKKCFVIGIVPNVPENYINLKRLWLNVGFHLLKRKFTIATDFKLCNIPLGMTAHGSLHPCCWCAIDKYHLSEKGNQGTLGNLQEYFWSYFDAGAQKNKAKEFGNVTHHPIPSSFEDSNLPILFILPPPELHLLTGPVNTMYTDMKEIWLDSEK